MSASIYWEPIKKAVKGVNVALPSRFIEAMREAFGDGSEWHLSTADLPRLRAMAAVERQAFIGTTKDNPYAELADAVEEGEHIRVWAEW